MASSSPSRATRSPASMAASSQPPPARRPVDSWWSGLGVGLGAAGVGSQPADRFDETGIQGVVACRHERLEATAHARVPEGLEVDRDRLGRPVGRQVRELAGDVVAHPGLGSDQGAHACVAAGSRVSATDASPRAFATPTWTAVTLYSGQLVAQSEFSVVTTFAPVTGWWNVV